MEAQRWPSLTETGNGDGGLSCPSPLRCPVLPAGIPAAEKPSLSPHPPLEVSRPLPPPGHLQFHVSPIWPVTSEVLVCASVCAHMCISVRPCIWMYCICAHTLHECACVYIRCLCTCVHMPLALCMCKCLYLCAHVRVLVCLWAHMPAHVCV